MIHPKLLLGVWLWMQRKESPRDHGQLSMVAGKFPWVFSAPLLNACGTDGKFCRRQRTITPLRLGLALTATCASQRVATLAEFPRGFPALFDTLITSKAFSHQVAKPHFAAVMRTMASRRIGELTLKVLGVAKGRGSAELRPSGSRTGVPGPSTTACAQSFLGAAQWSSRRPSHSIPPWIAWAMPQPPSS